MDEQALRLILHESAESRDGLETGGILIGRDDLERMVVMHAGGPGPKAERRPDRFLRDLAHARALSEEAWEKNGSQWIGEWHTHPNKELFPSSADLRSYLGHLSDSDLGFSRFLTIIVTVATDGIAVAAWMVYPDAVYAATIESIEGS